MNALDICKEAAYRLQCTMQLFEFCCKLYTLRTQMMYTFCVILVTQFSSLVTK